MTATTPRAVTRTCLVVGASRGIGASVSARLLAAGHRVALASRSGSLPSALAGPGEHRPILADVTSPEDVDRMFSEVEDAWGGVEVLVLSAGVAPAGRLTETSEQTWREAQAANVDGVFFAMRRGLPRMAAAEWGRIVVVASVNAKRGDALTAAYTASKHGALGLVRAAAAEYSGSGVTVNAVCPSYVDTPMTDQTIEGIAQRRGWSADEARERLLRTQPAGRFIDPDEVATAVEFCVASPAVTGQGINIDGGMIQS